MGRLSEGRGEGKRLQRWEIFSSQHQTQFSRPSSKPYLTSHANFPRPTQVQSSCGGGPEKSKNQRCLPGEGGSEDSQSGFLTLVLCHWALCKRGGAMGRGTRPKTSGHNWRKEALPPLCKTRLRKIPCAVVQLPGRGQCSHPKGESLDGGLGKKIGEKLTNQQAIP